MLGFLRLLLNNPIMSAVNTVYYAEVMFKLFCNARLKRWDRYWTGLLLMVNVVGFALEAYNYFAPPAV